MAEGEVLDNAGNHTEAIIEYDKAISLNPNDSGAHINKSVSLGDLGKNKEAIELLDTAIKIANQNGNKEQAQLIYKNEIIFFKAF